MNGRSTRIQNVQALRGFAANLVVMFHIIGAKNAYGYGPSFLDGFAPWGAVGVDIFFVISGFVMGLTVYKSPKKPSEFIVNRLIRIVPTYYFVTIVMFILYLLSPASIINGDGVGLHHLLRSLLFVSHLIFQQNPIAYVGWTLELELLFYLAITFSLYMGLFAKNPIFFILPIILMATFINTIIFEFIFGFIIAVYQKPITRFIKRSIFFPVTIILSSAALLITYPIDVYNLVLALPRYVYWGIPSSMVLVSCIAVRPLGLKLLSFGGEISYSTYLVQCLTIPVYFKFFDLLEYHPYSALMVLGCLIFTNLCGILLYYGVENRFMMSWRHEKVVHNNG